MRHVALLLAALCLLAPLAAVGGAATVGPAGTAGPTGAVGTDAAPAATTTPFTVAGTTFTVALQEDGDARWTVAVVYRFSGDGSRAAFRTYAERHRNNESAGGPSAEPFRNAASVVSNATGREMAVRDVNRTVGAQNETTGVLRLRFTWTNFLETGPSGELVLGDVFVSAPEETWLRTLQPGQRLVIEPPTGYAATDVSVPRSSIVNRNIVVDEPSTFAAGDISVTYESTGGNGDDVWGDIPLIVGSAGLIVLLAAGGYIATQRRSGTWSDADGDAGPGAVVPSTDSPGGGGGAVAGGTDGHAGGDAGTAGAVVDGDGTTATESEPDPALLSDEERVERLLERNGGRMRQADIVKETGWSDAKVSQLLSAMAEDGDVEKLRLGRENLISLPDGDERDDPRENGV